LEARDRRRMIVRGLSRVTGLPGKLPVKVAGS
jgi:hypothetical protein